jgi:hypothetical protein
VNKLFLTVAAGLLLAAPAFAADSPAGKWTGEQQGRQGAQPVVLEIKADGTGTMTTGEQPAVNLAEGKVSGAKVEFVVTRQTQNGEFKLKYTGEAKGDKLTLTREFMGAPPGGGGGGGGGGAGGGQAPAPLELTRAK